MLSQGVIPRWNQRLREKISKTFKVWTNYNLGKNKSSIIICFFCVKTIEILYRTPFFQVQVKIVLISDIDWLYAHDASYIVCKHLFYLKIFKLQRMK